MSPEALNRKRRRTDANEETQDAKPDVQDLATSAANTTDRSAPVQVNQPEKDEEFWFEDGTIILHAGDVEFRVYRGLLADQSPVFRDLFAQTHPTRTVSIDGRHDFPYPVVTLADAPHDLRHVLRAYMPRRNESLYVSVTPSFAAISASIRLGRKYDMVNLHQQALTFLKSHYTDKFDVWQTIGTWVPNGWAHPQVIGVVNLARLTGELSLLPIALMICATDMGENLVDGFTREDGSQEYLTLDDLRLCFRAQRRLYAASIAALYHVVTPPRSPTCKSPSQCSKAFYSVFGGTDTGQKLERMMLGDILLSSQRYLKTKDGKYIICPACLNVVNERDMKENRILWSRLPELLEIDVPGCGQPAPAHAPAVES